VLGTGGMGVVERAEDVDIGRPVAIKRLLPEATHPFGVARFVSEIRIVGSLDHPNVVPIHDVGVDDDGRYFFVMKYVEGQTLADVIDKLAAGDPLTHAFWTFERRAELMIAVLQALEYAHERGVIHRDVKPENIMVGSHGEIRLMDWGIAKHVGVQEPGEANGALIGTPAYMSPEQADRRRARRPQRPLLDDRHLPRVPGPAPRARPPLRDRLRPAHRHPDRVARRLRVRHLRPDPPDHPARRAALPVQARPREAPGRPPHPHAPRRRRSNIFVSIYWLDNNQSTTCSACARGVSSSRTSENPSARS
jgi:serine/threonine protein kinase